MRDKQIEEMAREIAKSHCKPSGCGSCYLEYGTLENSCEEYLTYKKMAEHLYIAGYRKASDAAREIFEEIEEGIKAAISALQFENNPIHRKVKHETYSSLMRFIKTIEKKYLGEDINAPTKESEGEGWLSIYYYF